MLKYCFIILIVFSGGIFAQDTTCLKDITPLITISNTDSLICEGELTVFRSQSFYGNAVPFYQWLVNGIRVGTNSPDYITNSLINGSRVECILTISLPSCTATKSATSQLTIYVYPMIHPAITITPGKSVICRGEEVTFTALANGGPFPTFSWEINSHPTGDVSASFKSNTLHDGDSVSCTITIDQDSRCHTTTSAPSNKVVMHVRDYADPLLKIDAPTLNVCSGDSLTFTATVQNGGDYNIYQWQVNGKNASSNSATFTNKFANGDKVSCLLLTNIPGCSITTNVISNFQMVVVRDTPVITFMPADTSVISGEPAQINAFISGNATTFMWKPVNVLLMPQSLSSLTIPLIHNTTINLTAVDINGCTATKDITINVLYKLYMPSAFTPNKDGKNDVFRIPPGASIMLHKFIIINRWGNVVFNTSDISKGWNGTLRGQNLDTGIYVYLIKGVVQGKETIIKGTVILLR